MKKLISLFVVMTMVLGSIVCAYAGDAKDFNKSLTIEELQEKIDFLNETFPEAELKVEDFLEAEKMLSEMSEIKRFEFVNKMMKAEPERVFYHKNEFGIDSALNVMSEGITVYIGYQLGDVNYEGSYATYNDTVVYLDFAHGLSNHHLSYKVNHERYLPTNSGYATWAGNLTSNNISGFIIYDGIMVQSTGTDVYAQAYYRTNAVGPGAIIFPTSFELHFNANTMSVSAR